MWFKKKIDPPKIKRKNTKALQANGVEVIDHLPILEMPYNELPEQDQINSYWFVEALWAFTWAGGLHDNLSLNTGVGSSLASFLPNIAHDESALSFIRTYKLRDKLELFTELDMFYRGHWFARNNQLTGRTSTKADIDLIVERRKALEFCCYSDVSWDEIDLST